MTMKQSSETLNKINPNFIYWGRLSERKGLVSSIKYVFPKQGSLKGSLNSDIIMIYFYFD